MMNIGLQKMKHKHKHNICKYFIGKKKEMSTSFEQWDIIYQWIRMEQYIQNDKYHSHQQ